MEESEVMREALLDGMRTGVWRAGNRIPTERQLSETYGIGRSAVRRVLAQMKAQGLVTQTVGSGTYVGTAVVPGVAVPELTPHTSPSELMESRIALEPAIVELVIRHATPADFRALESCCDGAEAAASLEGFEHWDREFHELVARAAHNAFVLQLFQTMSRARSQAEWGLLKRRSITPERRLHYQREHRGILLALKDRDVAAAVAHTRHHLLNVRRNLLGE
jgi:DNA-binding FadR family transcriptional regulator